MASTEETRALLAERVGLNTAAPDLDEALERSSGDVLGAALSILRARFADLVGTPAKWSVSGDYEEDHTANIAALRDLIGSLEVEAAAGVSTVTVAEIRRSGRIR